MGWSHCLRSICRILRTGHIHTTTIIIVIITNILPSRTTSRQHLHKQRRSAQYQPSRLHRLQMRATLLQPSINLDSSRHQYHQILRHNPHRHFVQKERRRPRRRLLIFLSKHPNHHVRPLFVSATANSRRSGKSMAFQKTTTIHLRFMHPSGGSYPKRTGLIGMKWQGTTRYDSSVRRQPTRVPSISRNAAPRRIPLHRNARCLRF